VNNWKQLWIDHVTWTRSVILGILDSLPGTDAYVGRLLQNADDMAKALEPAIGTVGSAQARTLLREHLTIAADILKAAKAGKPVDDLVAKWRVNGKQIVDFMAKGKQWRGTEPLREMWTMHLDDTFKEATSHLSKDWPAEIAAWDRVTKGAMEMAYLFNSYTTHSVGSRGLR
jgi:hypothetical protein